MHAHMQRALRQADVAVYSIPHGTHCRCSRNREHHDSRLDPLWARECVVWRGGNEMSTRQQLEH